MTHYVIVRSDLPPGVQAANLIHAAGESVVSIPVPPSTYAVALHVRCEAELHALAEQLNTAGLPRHLVIETEGPYAGQLMAIGITPCERRLAKKFLSSLPLIR